MRATLVFVGMYELVVNDKVQRENINSINYFRDDKLVQQAIADMEKLMEARQKSKEQERSSTKKSVLDALRSLKTKKQEQPAQEQDKPKKAKKKGIGKPTKMVSYSSMLSRLAAMAGREVGSLISMVLRDFLSIQFKSALV